jgi:hypothetical protein
MAKDYTKYAIDGVAENLGKSKLAYAIIENFLSKNSVNFATLNVAFPDECQGGIHGVFRKKEDVTDFKRYYMDKPITLIDGCTIVVSNQWGIDNIPGLINRANALGYAIKSVNVTSTISTPELLLTDKTETNIEVEIVSDTEYGFTNYANVSLALHVNTKLVEDFTSKCNRDTLFTLVEEITSNHTEEILMEAHNQSGLNELLENDFDWFNYDPTIRITEINDVNLGALYEKDIQSDQLASLLGVNEDEAADEVSDFLTNSRYAVDRELLISVAKKLENNFIAIDDSIDLNTNDENHTSKQLKYFPHSLEQSFPSWLDKIEIMVTNSIEKIYAECGENVIIHYNVKHNSIIKHHTNEFEPVHEYLDAFEVEIPEAYIENEEWLGEIRFMGIYENKDWEIVLNDNTVESQENVPADLKESLLKNFNSKNMFKFIDEVYQLF